jgi:hypothetical protein
MYGPHGRVCSHGMLLILLFAKLCNLVLAFVCPHVCMCVCPRALYTCVLSPPRDRKQASELSMGICLCLYVQIQLYIAGQVVEG